MFVLTAAYQSCLMWTCVLRLLSGLYQLFDLCLIKHVLIVWPLTLTYSMFGHQTMFDDVWSPNIQYRLSRPLRQNFKKMFSSYVKFLSFC